MKRDAEKHMERWFAKRVRKPLVIRGARQVGKSTLVRNFAAKHSLDLVEVNLEKHRNLEKLFSTKNIGEICRELEFLTDKALTPPKNKLLFLDEIQAAPEAIPCLRYFHEELPELAVVSAGSLLEFTLSRHHFSMPVGRIEYLFLGPMNFGEFLAAKGELKLLELISNYSWSDIFPESAHDRLCALLRDYLLVGGMPEALAIFIESESIDDVIDAHLSIIETYQDDFAKYARHAQLSMLQNVFLYVPQSIGRKVKYSNIDSDLPARSVKAAIDLLSKARVITKANHTDASGLPLGAGVNHKIYKLFFLDIGLVNTMCGTRHLSLDAMRNTRFVNEGNIAEQFVAQHLLYAGRPNSAPELFYWLREGKTGNAEVDFITQVDGKILPIEVKSGKSGALKSLQQFALSKKSRKALRFDLNPPSKQMVDCAVPNGDRVTFELSSLPLYMAQFFANLFRKWE